MSDGTSYSIYDMGITTSSDPKDYGKLEITTQNESKFETAISSNTSYVQQLFAKSSNTSFVLNPKGTQVQQQKDRRTDEGLIARLDDTIQAASGGKYGTYGSLVQIAGTSTSNTTTNSLYKEMTEQKSIISDLKDKMKTKKNKLYTEFQNLETYMSQANSQTSMLSSFGSSS
jgi:flagellar hook-associated protein 2